MTGLGLTRLVVLPQLSMLSYAQTFVCHIHRQVCQIFPLVDAFGPTKSFLSSEHLSMSRPSADAHSNCECHACAAKSIDHMLVNLHFPCSNAG